MVKVPPKPTRSKNGFPVLGQRLGVSSATVSFSPFDPATNLIVMEVQGADVWGTVDGTIPSAANGHLLYAGQVYHWSASTAQAAQFCRVSSTAYVQASEFVSAIGTDTTLTDTSIVKSSPSAIE